mmetsp:Transcript_31608/g.97675  ORF Transcript_31608/g.97675 Transcript_31608/m.97675 type:complete len:438 (-) Transcript_31608:119-1432(-)
MPHPTSAHHASERAHHAAVAVSGASPTDDKAVMAKAPRSLDVAGRWRMSLSTVSLVTLVVQNAMLVLMTRHARATTPPGQGFHTSVVVLLQEVLKTAVCLAVLAWERRVRSAAEYAAVVQSVVCQPECVKLALPAGLFTLQNFLIFVSLSNLDVMTFQILSQTKLLSAAIFSVWLLGKSLSGVQWGALLLLTAGVVLAQLETAMGGLTRRGPGAPSNQGPPGGAEQLVWVGATSCIVSGLSSSFAGVYFEKVVKTTPPSLAVRNIHLGLFGIPFAVVSMLVLDVLLAPKGPASFAFFRGFGPFTWALVAVHALGGLLVAAVVKYADNILKGFATAVAIIVSGVFASLLWGYVPSGAFVAGCALVIVAILGYQYAEDAKARAAKAGGAGSGGAAGAGQGSPSNQQQAAAVGGAAATADALKAPGSPPPKHARTASTAA